jgi:anaerobic selenocysteine-containing dehydrogenase
MQALGLPPLPVYVGPSQSVYPLTLCQGRTLTHFHSFYDNGRALPTLAQLDREPSLWISPDDAAVRGLHDGAVVRVYNERGALQARAHVTEEVPAGTVWMRDGWVGLNRVTSGQAVLPDTVVDMFGFSAGQASFEARVEVASL